MPRMFFKSNIWIMFEMTMMKRYDKIEQDSSKIKVLTGGLICLISMLLL